MKQLGLLLSIFFLTSAVLGQTNYIPPVRNESVTNKDQPVNKKVPPLNTNTIHQHLSDIEKEIDETKITNKKEKPVLETEEKIYTSKSSTNTNIVEKEEPTSLMVNCGLMFLQTKSAFSTPFSSGLKGEKTYYRMPFNSWNDSFYIKYSHDWLIDFLPSLGTRVGWGVELNFGGSGNNNPSEKVPADSDLGLAEGTEFYAIYNCYHLPMYAHTRVYPYSISIFDFYTGVGGGMIWGIYTYNELVEKDRSAYEEQSEQTFFRGFPFIDISIGVNFEIIDFFYPFFLELNYRIAYDPVVTNEFLRLTKSTQERSVRFQASGLFIGIGSRY